MRDDADENRYERVARNASFEWYDRHAFDRLAFANRVLDLIQPKDMSVVLYRGVRELRIERRQRRPGSKRSWASVAIPPHVPPERIVYALAELAGVADVPFVVDLLLSHANHPYR
ncbi:MAG: hypothetical protein AAF928_14955 [Myxococcota bacterium]